MVLGPTDLFDLCYLRDARLSPDGRSVAYAVSRTDKAEHFEIWIADCHGGSRQRLGYAGDATAPRWSPDGRWIAFVGDGGLRIAAVSSLRISDPLTPVELAVQGAASWSPDSAQLAVSLLKRNVVTGPRQITTTHFRADGLGYLEGLDQQIYRISLTGHGPTCLTSGEGLCSCPQWSPCGRRILYFATEHGVPFASYSPRLRLLDLDQGDTVEIPGNGWYITAARWLPDGGRVAVAGARDSSVTVPTTSLWVIRLADGSADLRTPDWIGNLGFRIHHDMPCWDLTQDNTLTIVDEQSALATAQWGGSAEIWQIGLNGEPDTRRILGGDRSCIVLDAHRAADALLFAATDLNSPTELYHATFRGENAARLTALNDEVLSRWPTTRVQRFSFASADGTEIEAWFMAPVGGTKVLPTVLFIHGGPFIATGHAFRYDFHLLCAHGFGVLFANFRGSAGYGEPFARAIMGDWGGRGYPDHMGAIDAAIAHGLADPERLGVWGASHGGFATCWIVGHTQRFKAAVAEAAFTHFATEYYLTDAPEGFQRDLGGRPHEIPEVYRDRSPLTYAHHCATPTLLIHGEDDLRCPISEAEQFYRALKDVGCPTELIRIPKCSHLGDSMGPLNARRAQNEALLCWFQRYL